MKNRTWREMKLYTLAQLYKSYRDTFEAMNANDDRRLFVNTYDMLIEAIKSLDEEPHIAVQVAMNRYITSERDILDNIRTRYNNGLWSTTA